MSQYPSDDERRYVRVTCPTCRAVLHPRVEKAGRRVRCPDCYAAVLVPQPQAPEPPPKPPRDPGEYKVNETGEAIKQPEVFLLLCPTCGARLHPRVSYVGKRVRCPDCEVVIVVPPPPKPEKIKELKAPGQYHVGAEPVRAEVKPELLLVQGTLPPEPPAAEPPRWWFASGVFTFPWRLSALGHWLTLSMFLVPLCVLAAAAASLSSGLNKFGSSLLVYLIVPLVWVFVWSMSYAAACAMSIMQDTAAGEIDVTQWPEEGWRERIAPLVYIAFEFFLGAALAAALGWPIGLLAGPLWGGIATFLVTAVTFPFFLLSALEADSPMTPYSPVILGSLPKLWWAWGAVAFESLAVAAFVAGLGLLAALWSPLAAFAIAPPLLAAMMFIVARLYGRLAWRIGELEAEKERRKKKKKKKPRTPLPAAER
jgi:DNA-directed RNA polymerase subunit RPC12/RpoP